MRLLAEGRASEIYDLGDGRVLRRYKSGGDPQREALAMEHARARGYPVPRVLDRREDALVLELIDGPTMAEDATRRPWRLRAHASLLADLHTRLHEINAPDGFPAAGGGDALLHLDLHPLNVLLSNRGPVVIDWTNARRGRPALDVAMTWLLAMYAEIPRPELRVLYRTFARLFARAVGRSTIAEALEDAAAYRLRDPNVPEPERRRIERLLR